MIVTSDPTALSAIITEANTGSAAGIAPPGRAAARASAGPARRPRTTKTRTGMPTVPNTPIGSRTKILISSHVSRSSFTMRSLADRAAGQSQEHILEGRQLGAEIADADTMFRDAGDGVGHEVAAAAANRDLTILHDDGFHVGHRLKMRRRVRVRVHDD